MGYVEELAGISRPRKEKRDSPWVGHCALHRPDAMPRGEFTPYPVKTAELDAASWWKTSGSARRMILEYCKYLAVLAREAFLRLGPSEHAANSPEPAR